MWNWLLALVVTGCILYLIWRATWVFKQRLYIRSLTDDERFWLEDVMWSLKQRLEQGRVDFYAVGSSVGRGAHEDIDLLVVYSRGKGTTETENVNYVGREVRTYADAHCSDISWSYVPMLYGTVTIRLDFPSGVIIEVVPYAKKGVLRTRWREWLRGDSLRLRFGSYYGCGF